MASEIRVNKLNSQTGVGTITLSPTGVDISGITTAATLKATTGIVTTLTATTGIVTTFEATTGNITTLRAPTGIVTTFEATTGNITTLRAPTGIVTTFVTNTAKVGAAVTISESGIEASGIGITCANINGGKIGGRKNLMINGSMIISQRHRTASVNATGHVIDRFNITQNGLDNTVLKQQVGVTTASAPHRLGFGKALKITNGDQTSAGNGDYIYMRYRWEGQEIVTSGWDYIDPNSSITLSFWIKSSVAQSFQMYFRSRNGTNYQYPFETGSLTADTWTKVIKTIPGNSNLVFDHDNLEGMYLDTGIFFGTNFTDNSVTNDAWGVFDTNNRMKDNDSTWYLTDGATLEITGFQLEVGDQATPFEHRGENEELALCQRYCYVIHMQNGDFSGFTGQALTADDAHVVSSFPVPMRDEPTYTGSGTNCRFQAGNSSAQVPFSSLSIFKVPVQRPVSIIGLRDQDVGSMTTGQALMLMAMANSGKMTFDAEV